MNPLSPAGMRLTYQVIHSSPKPSKSGNFGPMGFFFLPQPTWPNRPMATARLNLFNFLISEWETIAANDVPRINPPHKPIDPIATDPSWIDPSLDGSDYGCTSDGVSIFWKPIETISSVTRYCITATVFWYSNDCLGFFGGSFGIFCMRWTLSTARLEKSLFTRGRNWAIHHFESHFSLSFPSTITLNFSSKIAGCVPVFQCGWNHNDNRISNWIQSGVGNFDEMNATINHPPWLTWENQHPIRPFSSSNSRCWFSFSSALMWPCPPDPSWIYISFPENSTKLICT